MMPMHNISLGPEFQAVESRHFKRIVRSQFR